MRTAARRGGRLSRSAEFERVYKHGRSSANRHLVLYSFPNPAADAPSPRPVGVAEGRRRRRAQPRQAPSARGVRCGRAGTPPRPRRRRRRPSAGARAGRARGPGRASTRRSRSCWHSRACAPRGRRRRTSRTGNERDDASGRHPSRERRPARGALLSPLRRSSSISASSPRRYRAAASTSRRARGMRSTRSASTAYLGAWCSRDGACSGAIRGVTADTIRWRPKACSGSSPIRGAERRRAGKPAAGLKSQRTRPTSTAEHRDL